MLCCCTGRAPTIRARAAQNAGIAVRASLAGPRSVFHFIQSKIGRSFHETVCEYC